MGISKLSELKSLTEKLTTFADITFSGSSGYKQIKTTRGHAYIVGLSNSDDYSVTFNFSAKDTPFPEHAHNRWEYFVIIEGRMELTVAGNSKPVILERFGSYAIAPDTLHCAHFPEQTTYLAIAVPAEPNFPRRA